MKFGELMKPTYLINGKRFSLEELRSMYEEMKRQARAEGLKFPAFQRGGKPTKNALVLLALYDAYKSGQKWVAKSELNRLIGDNDAQQPRHLPRENGFYIISSRVYENLPNEEKKLIGKPPPSSSEEFYYALATLDRVSKAYNPRRHMGVEGETFDEIKAAYGYRCATCGAKEGEFHHLPQYGGRREKVRLQQGHINPHQPLEPGNIIPQCQFCNRAYRNWFVFDRNGRVRGVAAARVVLTSLRKGWLRGEYGELEEIISLISRLLEHTEGEPSNAQT